MFNSMDQLDHGFCKYSHIKYLICTIQIAFISMNYYLYARVYLILAFALPVSSNFDLAGKKKGLTSQFRSGDFYGQRRSTASMG